MKDLKTHSQAVLASRHEALTEALETRRKLGQYAVIVENVPQRRVAAEYLKPVIV